MSKYGNEDVLSLAAIVVPVAGIFIGKIWGPLIMLAWLTFGLKIADAISRSMFIGSDEMKTFLTIGIFVGGTACISALSFVI